MSVSSATGNISADGVQLEMKAATGTGSIEAHKSIGIFDLASGTGSVDGMDLIIQGCSRFASGTGPVKIGIACGSDYDMTVASGMADAILDYQGNPLHGRFEFLAIHETGKIVSPVNFEKEEIRGDEHVQYDRKSFQAGSQATPRIRIETGNGRAVLMK